MPQTPRQYWGLQIYRRGRNPYLPRLGHKSDELIYSLRLFASWHQAPATKRFGTPVGPDRKILSK